MQNYLTKIRTGKEQIGAQTFNFYLTACKSFCRWMVRDGRTTESRIEFLHGLNVRTDRRHDRRPLTIEEMIWLLDTTAAGPRRGTVAGPDRALVYRMAAETGIRSSELRSLTASSFDLEGKPPTVTVMAAYSKHRKQDVQLMKQATAELLKQSLATKMPTAKAFSMPGKRMVVIALRQDLAAARKRWLESAPDERTRAEMEKTDFLLYKDRHNRFADFHALRHVTGSYLAKANVSPKVAQSIMRHSDINLTMNFYSHSFREDEVHAIEKLPDLGRKPVQDEKRNAAG